jgi:hypothetical protein
VSNRSVSVRELNRPTSDIDTYVIIPNLACALVASSWMRGSEALWVVFLIVAAAETGRYYLSVPLGGTVYRSGTTKSGDPGPLPAAKTPRLHMSLS